VEEEKEEDAKTQRIILYMCVYIYAFNLKFTASKGLLNAEQKREFRIRIKESQRGVFVCLFSLVSGCFLGRNLKKIKKKMDQRSD
tara:strand:+ start:217 stop:471 length:255 start_codon:yes stop_codon:yes gene_type:complete